MCFIFLLLFVSTVSQKKYLEVEWTLWHYLHFTKIYWLYVRMIGVCGYGYIHGSMDISMDIHEKSVDMDMDMDGKFYIHGKPACELQ